jgi:hypothetical protein
METLTAPDCYLQTFDESVTATPRAPYQTVARLAEGEELAEAQVSGRLV